MAPSDNRELLYRQIANLYVQADGERLLREAEELRGQGAERITPRLDARARESAGRAARRRRTRTAGLLAAALVVALLAPQLLRYSQDSATAPAESSAAEAQAEGLTQAEPEAGEEADMGEETADDARLDAGAGDYEVIPLSFTLPENFDVIGIEQDNARSIYYLSDQLRDDVVLTMEYSDLPPATDGLVAIDLGGARAWGTATADYSLLTFRDGGILYTLTCRHDINTLLPLGESILL